MNNNNFEEIWKRDGWTNEARNIINGLEQFPEDSKLVMILRHSHREEITSIDQMADLGLTEEGKEIARIFGQKLPVDRNLNLHHSIVSRCVETAEWILKGFKEAGGKGEIHGLCEPLYHIEGSREYFLSRLLKHPEAEFLNLWAGGHFPPEKFAPIGSYSKSAAEIIWNMNGDASDNSINIFVTHDLHTMGLRYGWLGLGPCNYWVSFMGGFVLKIEKKWIKAFNNGKYFKRRPPFWWTK